MDFAFTLNQLLELSSSSRYSAWLPQEAGAGKVAFLGKDSAVQAEMSVVPLGIGVAVLLAGRAFRAVSFTTPVRVWAPVVPATISRMAENRIANLFLITD